MDNKFFFRLFSAVFFCMAVSQYTNAQTLPNGFFYQDMAGFTEPVGSTFNSSGTKMFVWEKGGRVYVCNWNAGSQTYVKQTTPVLNISDEVGNWRDHGMLGFALDPNFDVNGYIYVMYVVDRYHMLKFPDGYTQVGSYNSATNTYFAATIGRVTRYTTTTSAGNLVAISASRKILLGRYKTNGIPILYESHGVGSLAFAADGTLLISCGDAASYDATDYGSEPLSYYSQALTDGIIRANENVGSFRSQMLNSYSGKILRIDPATGSGISSNPFYDASRPDTTVSKVWALGLRNPFRMQLKPNTGSTNPATGDIGEIYVTDVGWGDIEELTVIREAASNCGWPYYEGLSMELNYATLTNLQNKDEPNPLYNVSGCTQQYFTFLNLLKNATADNDHRVYNPCNSSVVISSVNDNRFFHRIPSLDWKHNFDSARVAVFTTNNYEIKQIGAPGSGLSGSPFRGNAATGAYWFTRYPACTYPVQYDNSFFIADYGGQWIKNAKMQNIEQLESVDSFAGNYGTVVHISQSPMDGNLYTTDVAGGFIRKIRFGGNQPPIVKLSADVHYGPGPLTVNLTGSNSFDPEGGALTYTWDFDDGSPTSAIANPTHVFSSGSSAPKEFVVKLTVKDIANDSTTDSLVISINNTPPNVAITSPINNSTYRISSDTSYALQAVVTDAEHGPDELHYEWQTILRHNTHQHIQPSDTDKVTSAVISRIGCNGETYYWFVKLTVTDAAGLSTIDSSKIFPQCGPPLPIKLLSFSVSGKDNVNTLTWTTAEEVDLEHFEIMRSYDGANYTSIGTVNAKGSSVFNSYNFRDDNFLDGYVYYKLKMVDKDGKFTYSFIVRIFSGTRTTAAVTISPNPFKTEFLFGATFKTQGKATFRIIDSKGAVVKQLRRDVNTGFNNLTIDNLGDLGKGVYFLEVSSGSDNWKVKLVKE